jgi:WD40 repeat protein
MEEKNPNSVSIVPVGSTELVRVGNSIDVTNKILSELKKRELEKIQFKGNLFNEIKEIGSIRAISAVNDNEFQIATNAESSISKYNAINKTFKDKIKFNGHFEIVAFDNINNSVAIASGNSIYITSNGSGQIIQKLEGHSREINILIFSGDGKQLFSGSSDKTIRIWETENWKCASILEGHEWLVNSLKLTSDNKYLYSGGWDTFIIKWDLQTFKEVDRFYSGNIGGIKCLELTNDDKQIISGGDDKVVRIFNSSNFKIVAELIGHTDFVSCLSVSNDGKLLASGGWDGQIFIWFFSEQELINSCQAHSGRINAIKFSNDGKYLMSGCSDKLLKCWI